MTETVTLTEALSEFLLARIAEDEAAAVLVGSAPPKWTMTVYPHDGEAIPIKAAPFEPARVQIDCQMKRRIVQLHRPSSDAPGPEFEPYCEGCWEAGGMDGAPTHPCPTIRLVGLVYADHPDYRDEWRP